MNSAMMYGSTNIKLISYLIFRSRGDTLYRQNTKNKNTTL